MTKTRDGVRLEKIISAVEKVDGISVRSGTKHPYMLIYDQLRPCPVAQSTDAKKMIVPWLKQVEPLRDYTSQIIYQGLRQGEIQYLKN